MSNHESNQQKRALLQKLMQQQGVRLDGAGAAIPRRADADWAPLSFAQQQLWFLAQLSPDSREYNLGTAVRLRGPLDQAAFEQAWRLLVRRHSILRVHIGMRDGAPCQRVLAELALPLTVTDLSGAPEAEQEASLAALLQAGRAREFALERGPLFHIHLVRLGPQSSVALYNIHHIITDGLSLDLLIEEFSGLYLRLVNGEAVTAPPPALDYLDYAAWQRAHYQGDNLARLDAFWLQLLDGVAPLNSIPTDFPRPAVRRGHGAVLRRTTDSALAQQIAAVAAQHRCTPFMLLQSAWACFISLYAGTDDVLLGSPVSGRTTAESARMQGFLANVMVLRHRIDRQRTFAELLRIQRQTVLDCQAHQAMPFGRLADRLGHQRDLSRTPVFQLAFALQRGELIEQQLGGITITREPYASKIAQFDLSLFVFDVKQYFAFEWQFDTELFRPDTIERIAGMFLDMLRSLLNDPAQTLAGMTLVPAAQRQAMLYDWNPCHAPFPPRGTLHALFERQAALYPERIALDDGVRRTSYAQLNAQANRLAHALREQHAAVHGRALAPDTLIGLHVERGVAQVAGVLAILKAGAAYVPMSTRNPAERTAFIAADSGMAMVLCDGAAAAGLRTLVGAGVPVVALDDTPALARQPSCNPEAGSGPQHLAYMIYTSGTTGQPKGVLQTHASVDRLFLATEADYGFGQDDVWVLYHAVSFDFSVWEMWGALLYGGRLMLPDEACIRDFAHFVRWCAEHGVTVLNQTPAAFYAFSEQALAQRAALPALRYVIFGGDAVNLAQLRPWWQAYGDTHPRLVNMYGITETTVHTTCRPLRQEEAGATSPIGRPLADMRVYLLDERLEPVPPGTAGELYVGGAGLARGYHRRPDLTADRFIDNPFATPAERAAGYGRMYRSGDLARWVPSPLDGGPELEYLGRNDHQVKVRGYRIELGEIEAALTDMPQVQQALVRTADKHGHASLVAYVVAAPGNPRDAAALSAALAARLPAYMVPAAFHFLETIPLTLNGKVDQQALPAVEFGTGGASYAAPVTAAQTALCAVWQRVLGVERVGLADNFFALGGDSIVSLQLVAAAAQAGLHFSVQDLFVAQTVGALAPLLKDEAASRRRCAPFALVAPAVRVRLPADVVDAYPATRLQLGMLLHHQISRNKETYHNVCSIHMPYRPDLACLQRAVDQVIAEHDVLRTQFDFDLCDEPLQLVYRQARGKVEWRDLSGEPDPRRALADWQRGESAADLDLRSHPLFKLVLFKLSGQDFQLGYSGHHAILDGWSLAQMLERLVDYYRRLLAGEEPAGARFEFRFADYVAEERAVAADPEQQRFWRSALDQVRFTRLPRLPGPLCAGRHQVLQVHVDSGVTARLVALARAHGVGMKTLMLAAHLRVISHITGERETVTGLVCNGRPEHRDATAVLGLYLNTMVWRQCHDERHSWADSIARIARQEAELLPYARFPLAELIRNNQHQELFEVVFNYIAYDGLCGDGGREHAPHTSGVINYPLLVNCVHDPLNVRLTWNLSFDLGQLQAGQVARYAGYYRQALDSMLEQTAHPYRCQSLTGADELCLTRAAPVRAADDAHLSCLHTAVMALPPRHDARPAVIFEGRRMGYGELKARALQLAWHIQAAGIAPNQLVAIDCADGIAQVTAMLACSVAGVAYLPLDPGWPEARKARVMARGDVRLLLEAPCGATLPQGVRRLDIGAGSALWAEPADTPAGRANPDDLAYVIFTSGSTGEPKGVMLRHSAVQNTLNDMRIRYGLHEHDAVLGLSSVAFDLSVFDVFGLLQSGGTVVLPDRDKRQDPAHWGRLVREHGITLWNSVPAIFQLWMDVAEVGGEAPLAASIRHVLLSGDWLPLGLQPQASRLLPQARVHSLGGATEAAIWSITYPVTGIDPHWVSIPYGKAMHQQSFHVLDEAMRTCPIGTPGQLYIGGLGLADGYWRDPERTAASFLEHPVSGERLYKTGDLGRFLPEGDIEFLGRADFQVKIHGFRVELGEIESALNQIPGVKASLAALHKDGQQRPHLVAYVQVEAGTPAAAGQWRALLAERLPHYMVPHHYCALQSWPLSENGKVDRKALPVPDFGAHAPDAGLRPPANATEQALLEIVLRLLNRSALSTDDNFFMQGMDSIGAIQLVAQAKRAGIAVDVQAVFVHPSVRELAAVARRHTAAEGGGDGGNSALLPVQHWFLAQFGDQAHHFNQAFVFRAGALQWDTLCAAIAQLLQVHPLLSATLQGQTLAPSAAMVERIVSRHSAGPGQTLAALTGEVAHSLQSGLHLRHGPLIRFALVTAGQEQRLLVVCHHMVIDGVSWRILLDNFNHAYGALAAGRDPRLERPAVGFGQWAAHLAAQADQPAVRAQFDYWLAQASVAAPAAAVSRYGDSRNQTRRLDAALTQRLLGEANHAFRTDAQDLLLTALGLACSDCALRGMPPGRLSLMLENHGRQSAELDLSRTVGWFTQLYPLQLDLGAAPVLDVLVRVKETLRQVPDHGRAYGLLRYLSRDPAVVAALAAQPAPPLLFNYLGRVDGALVRDGYLHGADESAGADIAPGLARPYLLEINAMVSGERLALNCRHDPAIHSEAEIARLLAAVEQHLQQLADLCGALDGPRFTPSDVPEAGMDADQINDFLDDLCN
ncbi:amino acid adenylation domain-containing protein [Duganella sp. FT92W]|uniref:Amino acid adenylation domain-containing protein n=1 Tax=Pseudoduganella rivuli TaxID=2666085 RepID=A0A7X2LSJ7_9BURK|nr:non-ribosomal peptide synthetase [Pseudoduganella rivuli]MRV71988.1 amino acid adenylation domain-containing protein [Pseudoduganella rivuli]